MIDKVETLVLQSGDVKYTFAPQHGGFPSCIELCDPWTNIATSILPQPMQLEMELSDGRILHPVVTADAEPVVYEEADKYFVEFSKIRFQDQLNTLEKDFYLILRYELMYDGTAFVTALFTVERNHPPQIKRFEFNPVLNFPGADGIRFSLTHRPTSDDGPIIQSFFPERYIMQGENRYLKNGIFPMAGFNVSYSDRADIYAEFFVEGDNVVAGDSKNNNSELVWLDKDTVSCKWNFQNQLTPERDMPIHWRNNWGWIIKHPPRKRHLPPMQMYHFFDFTKRYPDDEQLEAIAAAGTNLLIIHENWRLDVQNDGTPYDRRRLSKVVDFAHKHNIRIALYIRGNELSAVEGACEWFRRLLKYDYDGLYMDYGSPYSEGSIPDEVYPNGRIPFRRHYLKFKALRKTVGADGLLFYHTGTSFSAIGSSFMDGYVSGEGERGIMVKGRSEHAYFSMASASLGTMWTAAFPEYATAQMVPFMASTGQYPHNPLGIQFAASSLIHPPEPGINDLEFRHLWKLWNTFADEKDILVANDYNCKGLYSVSDPAVGTYIMLSNDRKRMLVILSNFLDTAQTAVFRPEKFIKEAVAGKKLHLLTGDKNSACSTVIERIDSEIFIPAYGAVGILAADPADAEQILAEYRKPYPALGRQAQQWLADVAHQQKLRNEPPCWKEVYLTVNMPCYAPLPFEDSMVVDLYDLSIQLGVIDEKDASFKMLGFIGRNGFSATAAAKEQQLFPGYSSKSIALHELLPAGRYKLALYSEHLGTPFYSFIEAELAASAGGADRYTIEFRNELEPNRAYLIWDTIIG